MGTGITAILLHELPYNARWLYVLSIVVFVLNVVLFASFIAIILARCLFWPGAWTTIIHHSEQSLFLGAVPISLGTIVPMICYVCVDSWGSWAQDLAVTLWVMQVILSVMCAFVMPFLLISTNEDLDLSKVTARHLFPAVSCVVASASGSHVAGVLTDPQHALWTVVTSYVLWGIGVPMAMMTTIVYFHRLMIHKLPPRELMVSAFIPIGKLRFRHDMLTSAHFHEQVLSVKVAMQF
jgi:tellurite resistance protein TehA-like permease